MFVTGSNLFSQWVFDIEVIENFTIPLKFNYNNTFDLQEAKLTCISWSYNVLHINNNFIITGAWGGREGQIIRFPLPDECSNFSNLLLTCNDYNIILVDSDVNTIWVFELKTKIFKKVPITENPIIDINTGDKQIRDNIIKVIATNYSCIYLTYSGNVFVGTLPSYVETKHCVGKVCDVQCGYEHFVLLTDMGNVYTWGNGRHLQLGHGDVNNTDIPMEVEALSGIKIVKIRTGGWHTLALSESGDVYAWGWNDTGQLGIIMNKGNNELIETVINTGLPSLVDIYDENGKQMDINIMDISCGTKHSAILLEDNSIWTTGCNKYGQLGFSRSCYTKLYCFKKSFNAPKNSTLLCGPWCTVVVT